MRWTEALQGVRMAVFLNLLHRWESAELHLDQASSSVDGGGRESAAQGGAPAQARAAAAAGDDAASGRLAPCLARRPGGARPDPRIKSGDDDGRRDGGD